MSKLKSIVFEDDHSIHLTIYLSNDEQTVLDKLGESLGDPYDLYLAVYDQNDQMVGWSFGFQQDRYTFYMGNSGVLMEHRRKGIYSALLNQSI